MTKKLFVAFLCIILVFSVGCTNETVINHNYSGENGSDVSSNDSGTSSDTVTTEIITSRPDDNNSGSSNSSDTGSSVSSEVVSSRNEPVNTIAPGEQNEYSPYFFTRLNDRQKELYNKLFVAAVSLSDEKVFVTKAQDYKKSDISIAYMALTSDYPDIFWLDGKYTILAYKEGDTVLEYYVTLSYDRSYEQAVRESVELKEKVNEIVAQVKNKNVLEAEKFFHDYLCDNVEYNLENDDNNYTAFGALIKGKAVCEGYSRAMLLLCKSVGINCTLVRGTADNGEEADQPHMWNVIEIYGKWYQVDVTWDDPIREDPNDTRRVYTYFNLYDNQMYKNHTPYINLTNETLDQMTDSNFNYYLPICSAR